jgi:hypothetical protein
VSEPVNGQVSNNKISGIMHERVGLADFWTVTIITANLKLQPFGKKGVSSYEWEG